MIKEEGKEEDEESTARQPRKNATKVTWDSMYLKNGSSILVLSTDNLNINAAMFLFYVAVNIARLLRYKYAYLQYIHCILLGLKFGNYEILF